MPAVDKGAIIHTMTTKIRKIGIIFKRQDSRVQGIAKEIIPWLQNRGVEVFIDQAFRDQCPVHANFVSPEELVNQADIVVVFGGDGTLLYAGRLIGARNTPIIGINLGSLGFLTEVRLDEMQAAFEGLLAGQYRLEERVLLNVEVIRDGNPVAQYLALNDAVINKGALARIIDLEVSVNAEPVLYTRADGLIISTPTGSTAYSLAAGGPILYPTLEAVIIAPICPHALANRPLVIPDRHVVGVCLKHGSDVMLTVDGQVGTPLLPQDNLSIRRAQSTLRLALPFGSNFFKLLREKLRWG
ncbi:MAG: NAD(+)/NADH kinase [Acidobacteriota bacterium]|nr:NAD(+)/NADH kinase [Acidobacteriota bacterium]